MNKYIIELDDRIKLVTSVGVTENGVVYTTSDYVHDLEELNSDYINEHYGQLQDEAYQAGLDKAWQLAEDVIYNRGNVLDILHCATVGAAFDKYSAGQALDILEEYESKQKDCIEVGDEVIYNGTTKCIVIRPEDDERYASLIDGDGTHYSADHRECKKTGKHYDIASILEAMRK